MAFASSASDLVGGDTNGVTDVFVRDRALGITRRVSISSTGLQANDHSVEPCLSANGEFVAFTSLATNLVLVDTNATWDVFLHELASAQTVRVSISAGWSQGNAYSGAPVLSFDADVVAFASAASNLVAGDTNGAVDIFVLDLQAHTTERVSLSSTGLQARSDCVTPSISFAGRFIAFATTATLLQGDPNGTWDCCVRDRFAHKTLRVDGGAAAWNGASSRPRITYDGEWVAFQSEATDVVPGDTNGVSDVFLWRLGTDQVTLISRDASGNPANGASKAPSVSSGAEIVAFESVASDLVPFDANGTSDVFAFDTGSISMLRVSEATGGLEANGASHFASCSHSGNEIVFGSLSTDLVAGDTNGAADVFLRDLDFPLPTSYCTAKVNSQGCTTHLLAVGTPSATSSAPCTLEAVNELNNQVGILLYSTTGAAEIPLMGGLLCLQSPFVRTPGQFSGGAPPPVVDCSGTYEFDLKSIIQSGSDPQLVSGQFMCAQVWSRDPGFAPPNGANLTDGISLPIAP